MAAPSYAVSQELTLVANAEQHVTNNHYYDFIVVDNSGSSSDTTPASTPAEVWVCFDGGTATVGGAHCQMVESGQTRIFGNVQALPNPNVVAGAAKYANGVTGAFDQSEAVGWTAQQGYNGTNLTYASVISAGTPIVNITFE